MNADVIAQAARNNPERWQQAQERLSGVLSRSATDYEFRQQLLTDSRAALSRHLGRELPETVNIRFIDAHGTPTVVLPDPVGANGELSETELETVAGGLIAGVIAAGAALYCLLDHVF